MRHLLAVSILLVASIAPSAHGYDVAVAEVNPTSSTLDATNPNGASGGRVNGISVAPNGTTYFAASEWGGLWRSTDSGRVWAPLQNHLPMVTWDVKVDPSNGNQLYATSFYDGRVSSLAGINVSSDGGNTWTKPVSATPPAGFCATAVRRDEPAAFGISIDAGNTASVAIGTNCGLALSTNSGNTWNFVNPFGPGGADDVWDVTLHNGGIIDVCGSGGHARSINGGANWTTATTNPLPGGRCSIAVSPTESYVLFAVVGTTIYESDDSGGTWPNTLTNPNPQGRIPYVATNRRTGDNYDLWFGDVKSVRAACTTPVPAAAGGARRCPANTWTAVGSGAHDDMGSVVFATGTANNACPVLISSDGGVYYNTLTTSPGCQTPTWEQPNSTPRGLWIFAMTGAAQSGAANIDLYMGAQDTGSFATTNAGAAAPTWTNQDCCDAHDMAAEPARVVYTVCCYGVAPSNRVFVRNPGMTGGAELNTYPAGTVSGFRYVNTISNLGAGSYALLTTSGIFVTTNIGASPVVWTQLGAPTSPAAARGVHVSVRGGVTVFYVTAGIGDTRSQDRLWTYTGTAAGGTWTQIQPPGSAGGFGIVAVDPNDADRLLASHLRTGFAPQMVMSTDGGANWNVVAALDTLMTATGTFRYQTETGAGDFTSRNGYPQPTLVAFDPLDSTVLVAGGADSGVFLSVDSGATWRRITDPLTPGTSGIPHIPRPRFAHFDHEGSTLISRRFSLFIGSQGRGAWRFDISFPRIIGNICVRYPFVCTRPILERGIIRLDCPGRRECIIRDFIPRNCLLKYTCPGCQPGSLCPPYYHFFLEEFDPRAWEVGIFTSSGRPVPAKQTRVGKAHVISFRPAPELFRAGSIGDYELIFATKTGDKALSHRIKTRLELSDSLTPPQRIP